MPLSHQRTWELLREVFDPEDQWWWTAYGLLTLSHMARRPECKYWMRVYEGLRREPCR